MNKKIMDDKARKKMEGKLNNVKEKLEDFQDIILDFYDDHKKALKISLILTLLFVIGIIVFFIVYTPVKVTFEGEDSKVVATLATNLNIKATATDKKGTKYEIKWTTTGGTIDKDVGDDIVWSLPEEEGTYSLIANVGEKKFVKKVSVLKNELLGNLIVENYVTKDTDSDGLSDEYEKNTSKTNETLKDTDNDGLYDGNEVVLGLDPTLETSKNDGIIDFSRTLTYTLKDIENGVNVVVNGSGNIVNTTVDKYSTKSIQELVQVASENYNIYSEGNIESAKITISYNKENIISKGINENNLSIYKIVDSNNNFEKIGTTIDVATSTLTADVKELGKFFIADSSRMVDKRKTELMFVIDNSGSMYSSKEIAESASNDPEFKRVDLSTNLIDKLNGDYKFAASKFTFDSTILSSFTDNKEEIKQKIDTIKTVTEKFTGTYIGNALTLGVNEFPNEVSMDRRYIILLTDGKDTTNVQGYDKDKIEKATKIAKEKQIKVFTIGLGSSIDKEVLSKISTNTGGKFYYTSSAEMLENIYDMIASEINYNLIDIDQNGIDENIVLKDSEFSTTKDGFSFENFFSTKNKNGTSYGMALFSKLYYEKTLPTKLSKMSVAKRGTEETVTADAFSITTAVNKSDLVDYKFTTLKFLNEDSKLLRSNIVEDKLLSFKSEYKTSILKSGFGIYNQAYNSKEAKFKYYENYFVDFESKALLSITGSDLEMLKALNRFDILKYKDDEISFVDNPDTAYKKLLTDLGSNKPVLLKINDNYTLLATRISFDFKDPNKMKIEVYDNNIKNRVKYIDVERILVNDKIEGAAINKYNYKFKYNNVDVNLKLSIPNISANL